jgi:D-3-phosphoglycerate dehydrogenase / 2-oxoglutarate reductase
MLVVVTDPIAQEGLDCLRGFAEVELRIGVKGPDLLAAVADAEALVVRSETQVTAEVVEAGAKLQVIGRAGVGVDNIDVEAATRRGILVVNSPTGNTIAATEHTLAMLLALARNIPQAYSSLKAGEWQRSRFVGSEIRGRTLGILGLGKIGQEVAKRARGFEMELVGYDPYVSAEQARAAGIELLSVPEIMKRADFITVHTPLTPATTNLVGEKELKMAKPGLRLINCARGGIINEEALAKAVADGRVAGAAIDVFTKEPATDNVLVKSDGKIIVTPHLGASTEEAQVAVAIEVAKQIEEVAQGQQPRFAVNAPSVLPEALEILRPYLILAEKLGRLYTQLTEGQIGSIELTLGGDVANQPAAPITAAVLKGILESTSDQKVNLVNAGVLAKGRGLTVSEKKVYDIPTFESLVTLQVADTLVAGTVEYGEPRIVQMNRYRVDLPASGIWLLARHRDQPGMIGRVGTLLGDSDVNISGMQVGRLTARGDDSLMVLIVDDPVSDDVLARVRAISGVGETWLVSL